MVYLITGKKGAGKSTYASRLVEELRAEGKEVEWIDGDRWREEHKNQDYSDKGRYQNLMSAAHRAQEYEKQGKVVILSFVAPYKGWRDSMRKYWQHSHIIYIPGGTLWEGTVYDVPDLQELCAVIRGHRLLVNGTFIDIYINQGL